MGFKPQKISVAFRRPSLFCVTWSILIFSILLLMTTRTGQAQTYTIDNGHTSLVFAISHAGLSYTYGRFNECSGDITVDDNPERQSFNFTIAADSIDTNNLLRDDHLKGPKFFDAQAFPSIEFRSVKMTNLENTYAATGVLTMHGVKQDISLDLTKIGKGAGPRGDSRIGFFSKFNVKRSDFGIVSLPTTVGDQVAITLSFEGILKPEQADNKNEVLGIEGTVEEGLVEGTLEAVPAKETTEDELDAGTDDAEPAFGILED